MRAGPTSAEKPRTGLGIAIGVAMLSPGVSCGGHAVTIPLLHRPVATTCPTTRGPGCEPSCGSVGNCGSDSDCDAGINGRCTGSAPLPFLSCTYDRCFSDSDCAPKTPCICRTSSSDSASNMCPAYGNCAVDSDCGPNGYCSPSISNTCLFVFYFCHTPNDLCVNNQDCATPNGCAYDFDAQRWQCSLCILPP